MNKSKNIIFIFFSVLVIIISLPFFIKNSSLYFFKGTTLNEKSIVEKILKETEYGKDLKEFNILDNTLNINYDLDYIKYEILEKNSSILFYLIEDYVQHLSIISLNDCPKSLIYNSCMCFRQNFLFGEVRKA